MAQILIIEDDYVLRVMLANFVKRMGHQATQAFNAEEGLGVFRRAPIDLVITDLMMPGQGGLRSIHSIRAICPDVKIVVISAHEHLLSMAAQEDVDRVFAKPFDLTELSKEIQKLLEC